ncbi:hypothetical protein RCO48_00885 [Peribacillus frigoritolerans]|nr:hypothetical protein [Peribacillus frigoritolerans]
MERVTDEDIKEFTKDELEVIAIFREFNSGYALAPSIVKNKDVSTEGISPGSVNIWMKCQAWM